MFAKVTTQPFFPTCVWVHDLEPEIAAPLNRRLFQVLDELTAPRPPLAPGQGWQTDQTLHELPEFKDLVELFEFASKAILDQYQVRYESFLITGCWANISPPGGFHIPHLHPNNFLSGVYYVQAEEGANTISFHDPRPQLEIILPDVLKHNKLNSTVHQLKILPGRLVMFPAWFVHSVPRNESSRLRVSVSFNIMFSSFAEKLSRPKWSGIPLGAKRAQ
ncbi:MAG: 2OG-Fe(II) oxygenase family protein [Kiloniellaceae bacterium]